MYLLNINDSNQPVFDKIFGDIERESNFKFAFIYGFNSRVSVEFINDSIEQLIQIEGINESVKIFPIVLSGINSDYGIKYHATKPPAFHYSLSKINLIDRSSNTFLSRLQKTSFYVEGSIVELPAPSGSIYGEIHLPRPTSPEAGINDSLRFPTFFLNYPIVDVGVDDYICEMTQYITRLALSTFSDSGIERPDPDSLFSDVTEQDVDIESASETFMTTYTSNMRSDIRSLTDQVDRMKSDLINSLRKLTDLNRNLSLVNNTDELKRQFEIISRNPNVTWFELKGTFYSFLTKHIVIESKGTKYDIGKIIVSVDLVTGRVYFDNITRRVKGYACSNASHPHDASSGNNKMCLGEIEAFIPQLINQLEFASLTDLLITFAESVNTSDIAGKTIERWPVLS